MKKIFSFLLLLVSAFTFGQNSQVAPYSFKGTIYDSSTFSTLTAFTVTGATASIVSSKIQLTGGNQTISATIGTANSAPNQYIRILPPGGTMLERWRMVVGFKLTTAPSASSAGIAIGTISSNTITLPSNALAYYNMTTGSGAGKVYTLVGGLNATAGGSVNAVPVVQNDRYVMTIERVLDSVYVSVKDVTTDTASAVAGYKYDFTSSSNLLSPNTGNFAIQSLGGTIQIDSIHISSKEIISPNLLVVGDSKMSGYSNPFQLRVGSLVGQILQGTVVSAGQSDRSQDVINHLPELVSFRAKQALLCIGRNDLFAGTAAATWHQNLITIDSTLTANGTSVYWMDGFYETSIGQGGVSAFLNSQFPGRVIHTLYPGSQLGATAVAADGVHPTYQANALYANLIINSGFFKNYSAYVNDAFRDINAKAYSQNYFTQTNSFQKDIFVGGLPGVNYTIQIGTGNTTAQNNIFMGGQGLGHSVVTGTNNICIGQSSGFGLTSGLNNTAVGSGTLFSLSSGSNNTYIGTNSGTSHTGGNNTGVGVFTVNGSGSSSNNTAVGYQALKFNSSGSNNTALGFQALLQTLGGIGNSALGLNTLEANTTGSNNTAFGTSTGDSTNQDGCVYLGYLSGFKNSVDNKLFINNANSFTSRNLIYGDFALQRLQISAPANPTAVDAQFKIGYTGSVIVGAANGALGVGLSIPKQHYSDNSTGASGTVARYAVNAIGQDSLSTSATGVTYTDTYGTLFPINPVATASPGTGGTPTLTNSYSVGFDGDVQFNGGTYQNIRTTAAGSETVSATDYTIIFTGTTSSLTMPSLHKGRMFNLVNHGSGSVTLGTAVTTANGTTSTTITAGSSYQIHCDGTVFRKIN